MSIKTITSKLKSISPTRKFAFAFILFVFLYFTMIAYNNRLDEEAHQEKLDSCYAEIERLCEDYDILVKNISIKSKSYDEVTKTPTYTLRLTAEMPEDYEDERLLRFLKSYNKLSSIDRDKFYYVPWPIINGAEYSTYNDIAYKDHKAFYPKPTPEPTPTPKPSGGFKPWPSKDKDPYNAEDYSHPDDFYYDYPDDFYDLEEAEDYYDMYG